MVDDASKSRRMMCKGVASEGLVLMEGVMAKEASDPEWVGTA